ncbi:glycerol-3-phosphate dehydrogenase/oxidase [Pseudoteredinibacter isoporae]|uniref:Glycerol-3-phosphate dehydrogenase n=1 Tax=Pseudoteredinibacter isoporae TaxID=570281 RepID=A0A7X0JU67_9GAMM|nr:glycerol-3-phosphate dehydrogenase/oxidase [Pseudoteredinibacter isoporae]MBB6521515.1 glycerol-3-phosphate dehydrogenase [Pseudoteredinibacter isoporae]NHO87069.1 glycerol-3-phosphate dehydrogenase/oxidase [Pseudoteredinibacter isoporae]NIB22816.1 glycerol-3-phosphate dehydrogenase/oxidase [Pseudoteredinibacter isoporae]
MSKAKRRTRIESARRKHWDMIVVGGGITGAGVAREAARRGLSVLVLEQKDFAWGTSSRSSKMVHGGLRYLAMGDRKLTRESLLERERLLKEAPGLVERMGYYFLLPKSWKPWRLVMKLLLASYDRIAGIKNHKICNNSELGEAFSKLDQNGITGAAFYTDAVTDDSRLVYRVLQEAEADGASLLNYCAVKSSQKADTEHQSVEIQDAISGEVFQCKASVIVNSTGAWADRLRQARIDEQRVRPLKGSHIVLRKGVLPIEHAISCQHPDDKRSVFVFPWEGHSVIGTTDLDYEGSLDQEANISKEELEYLLAIVRHHFPSESIDRKDIVSTWSGVRPVIAGDKQFARAQKAEQGSADKTRKKPSKERRDHAVWDDDGLISAAGGKLTTFRVMALDVLEKAAPYLKGWQFERDEAAVFRPGGAKKNAQANLNEDQLDRLEACYGFRTSDFLATAKNEELKPLFDQKTCAAQLRWALREEWVEHLDDLLLRRTRLGLLLPNGASQLFELCKTLCQEELEWSEQRWAEELERYQDIWHRAYSLPA